MALSELEHVFSPSAYEKPTQIGASKNITDAFKFHAYGFGYNVPLS